MKRPLMLLFILSLCVPVLFLGCSGDDGATGATGAQGPQGDTGAPGPPGTGVLASETCSVCHGVGKIADVVEEHGKFLPLPANQGTVTATINSVTFGTPAGDNVPVTVNFTPVLTNADGTSNTTDLTTKSAGNLSYVRFSLVKLTAGTNGNADAWGGYLVTLMATGSGPFASRNGTLVKNAGGDYTYTFPDNAVRVSDGYVDNTVHRVAIQMSGFPAGSFTPNTAIARPVGNFTADMVNPVGGGTVNAPFSVPAGYPRKDVVTTAACNECHNPLAIHGGGRRDTKFCVACHNAKTETVAGPDAPTGWPNSNLVNLVHKIHTAQDLGRILDATEVTYPILLEPEENEHIGIRDVRNCTKCHKGLDGDNWKTRPTREACGSCHVNVNFATGAGHLGGAYTNDAACAICHTPGPGVVDTEAMHRTQNLTPNNANLPAGLDYFEYNITSVTVDTDNVTPVVKFWIKKNGAFLDLLNPADNTIKYPTGYSTSSRPSFLVAWAMPQDGVTSPADYTNTGPGRSAGQPPTVNITGLAATGTSAEYTVKLTAAKFPAGAKMRAVALQGYFTQIVGTDNIGRHTPSVVKGVTATGEAVRRTIIKSGYVDNAGNPVTNPANFATAKPYGCLECHEIFEAHGGSRVNNVQVCVICHNPNLSSSGRTVDPSQPSTAEPDENPFTILGPDPLQWPEATNNFKSLIHGIHRSSSRPYEFVRNRLNGIYFNWDHVTFPGELFDCQKCHLAGTYDADLPANQLLTTERITTGNAAETRDQILAARTSMPNTTDLVDSPIVAACYYCHDDSAAASHFLLNGGKLKATRADALLGP